MKDILKSVHWRFLVWFVIFVIIICMNVDSDRDMNALNVKIDHEIKMAEGIIMDGKKFSVEITEWSTSTAGAFLMLPVGSLASNTEVVMSNDPSFVPGFFPRYYYGNESVVKLDYNYNGEITEILIPVSELDINKVDSDESYAVFKLCDFAQCYWNGHFQDFLDRTLVKIKLNLSPSQYNQFMGID